MNEYLLILKMIASQEPRHEDYEFFPGNCSRTVCPVCQRIITLAKLAVAEAEKLEAKNKDGVPEGGSVALTGSASVAAERRSKVSARCASASVALTGSKGPSG
nr:MAG TPA: Rad50 zinc hook motif [Caudoviricetes sp.]